MKAGIKSTGDNGPPYNHAVYARAFIGIKSLKWLFYNLVLCVHLWANLFSNGIVRRHLHFLNSRSLEIIDSGAACSTGIVLQELLVFESIGKSTAISKS